MSGGWFADTDDMSIYKWQPVLELADGTVIGSQIWFTTQDECITFIQKELAPVGSRLADRPARPEEASE